MSKAMTLGEVSALFEAKTTEGCRIEHDPVPTVYISQDVSDNMPEPIIELRDKYGYIIQTEIT